jgi:oligoribonuclease NrnB/cAMP/cGMP phosphodiesterase (DHH superfamily)
VQADGLVFEGTLQAMAYQAVQESCETLARKRDLDIEFAMENCLTEWPLGEYRVAIINCHRSITSEMCDRIKDSYDVVATYFHKHRGSMVSLRSKSYDVATLAEKLGGGGHRNAAGVNLQFSITPEVLASMLHDAQTSLLVESEVKNG